MTKQNYWEIIGSIFMILIIVLLNLYRRWYIKQIAKEVGDSSFDPPWGLMTLELMLRGKLKEKNKSRSTLENSLDN